MAYKIVGMKNGKKYASRKFKTEKEALKYAYSTVYKKDGNNKRNSKKSIYSFEVVKV